MKIYVYNTYENKYKSILVKISSNLEKIISEVEDRNRHPGKHEAGHHKDNLFKQSPHAVNIASPGFTIQDMSDDFALFSCDGRNSNVTINDYQHW